MLESVHNLCEVYDLFFLLLFLTFDYFVPYIYSTIKYIFFPFRIDRIFNKQEKEEWNEGKKKCTWPLQKNFHRRKQSKLIKNL